MASLVLKQQCDRCPQVDEVEVSMETLQRNPAALSKDTSHSLRVEVGGKTLAAFDYLCGPCHEICLRHITQIGRVSEKKSSVRMPKKSSDSLDIEIEE